MKTLVAMLLLALIALMWLGNENPRLNQSLERAQHAAVAQDRVLADVHARLSDAQRRISAEAKAQSALRTALERAGEQAQRREQMIARLLNENDAFRRWYDTELPDAVRRLHQRAACASAGDCLQRLSGGEPVPDAGEQPAD